MASPTAPHWLLRDLRLSLVLCLWMGLGLILLSFGYLEAIKQQDRLPVAGNSTHRLIPNGSVSNISTGSIIIVGRRDDQCRQQIFDNRTGKMWDIGYVNCHKVLSDLSANNGESGRVRVISKAFRNRVP
jgi:hypothetical protein